MQVELDADGHEEEAHQHIAEGLDVLFHLELVLGFRDQHAGHEGTERQREAGQFGDGRQAQRDEQHVEDEHFGRLGAGHEVEPLAHQALAEDQNHGQHDHRLEQGDTEQHGQLFRRLGQ